MKLTVLIADDETMPRITLRDHLPWDDFFVDKIVLASDGQEALKLAKAHHPDIIISDMKIRSIRIIQQLVSNTFQSVSGQISTYLTL